MNFEFKEFASIPADDRNEFAFTLEPLAFKKKTPVFIFLKLSRKNSMLV